MEFIIHTLSSGESCRIILLLGNQNDNLISNHNRKYQRVGQELRTKQELDAREKKNLQIIVDVRHVGTVGQGLLVGPFCLLLLALGT